MHGKFNPINLLLSNMAIPLLERVSRTRFWTLFHEMQTTEALSSHAIQTLQDQRLARLLSSAADQVDFWKDAFAAENIPPDRIGPGNCKDILSRLPVLTKEQLRTGATSRHTSHGVRDKWQYSSTAGTTGDRLSIIQDFIKRDYKRAVELRIRHRFMGYPFGAASVEIPANACNVACGLMDEGPPGLVPFIGWAFKKGRLLKASTLPDLRGRIERQIMLRKITLPPLPILQWKFLVKELDQCLDQIQAHNPIMLTGLPIYLVWLAFRGAQRRIELPRLRFILPYGGGMSPSMAKRVEAGLGGKFFDFYGSSELGGVACACGKGDGMHVFEDLFKLEILDENHQPLPPGRPGRMVVTDLMNHAMPLIRYEVGDWGQWIEGVCPCGRETRRVEILGRDKERLNCNGRTIHARSILDICFQDPNILNIHLDEQAQGRFKLWTVQGGGIRKKDLEARLQRTLALGDPPQIQSTAFIQPTSSGKFCNITPLSQRSTLL